MTKEISPPSQKQVDKLFNDMACDLYDKFLENVEIIYEKLLPFPAEKDRFFEQIGDRLIIEFANICETGGKPKPKPMKSVRKVNKNAEKKESASASKRTVVG